MLPQTARMRSSSEFRDVVRRGVRSGRPTLIVHAGLVAPAGPVTPERPADGEPTALTSEPGAGQGVRVGFVVSKAVGNAVTRNRVKRRLRHLAREALPATPAGLRIVVRALPRATTHPRDVPGDLSSAWAKAVQRLDRGQLQRAPERLASSGRPRA